MENLYILISMKPKPLNLFLYCSYQGGVSIIAGFWSWVRFLSFGYCLCVYFVHFLCVGFPRFSGFHSLPKDMLVGVFVTKLPLNVKECVHGALPWTGIPSSVIYLMQVYQYSQDPWESLMYSSVGKMGKI